MSKFLFFDFNIPFLLEDKKKAVGGATVQSLNWIQGLISNEKNVGVLVEKESFYPKESLIDFIETFPLKGKNPILWIYPRFYLLNKSIKKYTPNYLIQAGAGFIVLPLSIISKLNGIKFIHRIANNVDVDKRLFKKISLFGALSYKLGLAITPIISCQNEYQYNTLKKKYPKKSIIKLVNPFDSKNIKSDIVQRKDRRYVSWIGNFQYQKNLPLLLKITKEFPDVNFKIAGKANNNIDKSLITILRKLENQPNVNFVGYLDREELYMFLSKSICLLNTSFYEGFPNTFLESFAVGTPILTTDEIDPDNIIKAHNLGVSCSDFSKLPWGLKYLIDLKEYNNVSLNCKNYITNRHNREGLSYELIQFLRSQNNDTTKF